MKRYAALPIALCVASTAPALAQEGIEEYVFPPEVVMQAQRQIDLQGEQRDAITKVIREFQREQLELDWDLQDQTQRLTELMSPAKVDEKAAMEQVARLMQAEERMKRAHLRMLIRIKNLLTEDQQMKLHKVMAQHRRQEQVRHQKELRGLELDMTKRELRERWFKQMLLKQKR